MSTEVVVAVDGSDQSDEALEHALSEFSEAELTALTAIDPVAAGYAAVPGPDALGSPAETVVRRAPCAVTVVR